MFEDVGLCFQWFTKVKPCFHVVPVAQLFWNLYVCYCIIYIVPGMRIRTYHGKAHVDSTCHHKEITQAHPRYFGGNWLLTLFC